MLFQINTIVTAVANQSRAMESGNHFKNGASPKSQMSSNFNFIFFINHFNFNTMKNNFSIKTEVANHGGAMEARDHLKNRASLRRLRFLIFMLFVSGMSVYAQDIITMRNGDEIKAKVTELSSSEIKYKRFENLEGPTIVIRRADVFAINYEDGRREVINTARTTSSVGGFSSSNFNDYSYFVGLVGGYGILGPVIGIQGAYFFHNRMGAGLTLRRNTWTNWYDWSDGDSVNATFFGAVFYGHWGQSNSNFYFPTAFGFGVSTYKETDLRGDSESFTIPAIYLSQGVAYRVSNLFSCGVNFEIGGGSMLGVSAGINFHF